MSDYLAAQIGKGSITNEKGGYVIKNIYHIIRT